MAQSVLKPVDRQAGRDWDSYYESFIAEVAAETNESAAEQKKRIARLEANFEDWKQYYFPKYCYAPSAGFHKRAAKRELNNPEWYESRVWARELAKDVVEMMVTIYQALTRQKKNILFISNSLDKAAELLEPYRINLWTNERIINDYGNQFNPGAWTYGDFVTTQGVSFLAVGAGQSPRGSRNEEVRPDKIIISDIDTDEDVRNTDIINKRWEWFEKAVFPTRSVSKALQVIWLGNLISKDCCVARATEKADKVSLVNLEDKEGNSTWPEKNSPENIARIKSKISTAAYQAEYMNNPLTEGSVFKQIIWGKIPPLHKFRFLIAYGDPAPSNSENKAGSLKGVWLVGKFENKYYVINGFLEQKAVNATFVGWYPKLVSFVGGKTHTYLYIENNTLQNPFYDQVYKPLFNALPNGNPGIIPDERKKPDKFTRIEGGLEPINRDGLLILNEDEKENPHFKELETQFKLFSPKLKYPADGPDCIEGAKWIIDEKESSLQPDSFKIGHLKSNPKKRF
ncbi:MAG: hypothetical protein A2W90_14620 [Bacteroidetes bacterium GWF2_42_66]|nr:MAG: hypothetical protein A2W92_16015 [Bacteroidetes bacterium GWA2_42_15]OFX99071.1 MAG: hypothetical protein A2W89_06640 [Bacteroidetes bacterium GWE2_42_39]OFY46760.1 MAG: hypothetical protein A2W90_14620 [Bacteroidetes bacterium GWF2_42_66]HBL73833.1 hypothetical protein [Prolixibacteraceae bacterium]HCR89500.1 hypothetical protein [Prolixibacteraceae bacterium]